MPAICDEFSAEYSKVSGFGSHSPAHVHAERGVPVLRRRRLGRLRTVGQDQGHTRDHDDGRQGVPTPRATRAPSGRDRATACCPSGFRHGRRLPGGDRTSPTAPGLRAYRQDRARGEKHSRERQQRGARTGPSPSGELPRRAVMGDEHPVRTASGGRALNVPYDARGFVRDLPAGAAQSPAEVDVLEVHEVALVPAADGVEGTAPQPDRRAREPVDQPRPLRGPRRVGDSER